MKKVLSIVIAVLAGCILFAQGEVGADPMRGHHKIYVSITVLAIILCSIFLFLVWIERRLRKMESDPPN